MTRWHFNKFLPFESQFSKYNISFVDGVSPLVLLEYVSESIFSFRFSMRVATFTFYGDQHFKSNCSKLIFFLKMAKTWKTFEETKTLSCHRKHYSLITWLILIIHMFKGTHLLKKYNNNDLAEDGLGSIFEQGGFIIGRSRKNMARYICYRSDS